MGTAGILGVALAASLLEGIWTWLLAAAIAEVAGQDRPSTAFVVLVLLGAWLCSRMTAVAGISETRRRQILALSGLTLALAAGTVQAGVLLPIQLVFGQPTPDLRAAGIALLFVVAYLWARGLWLAIRVTRRRLINHIIASGGGLIAVLVFLPLADVIREAGLGAVVASFVVGTASLLLIQLTEAESHQLTRAQWVGVGMGMAAVLVVGATAVSGAFSSGALGLLADGAGSLGRAASPLTNAILLGLGYGAHALTMLFHWLGEIVGVDAEAVLRGMRGAQEGRPQFENLIPQDAPEVLAIPVAVFVTVLTLVVVLVILLRLVRPRSGQGEGVAMRRDRIPGEGAGIVGALRSALDRLRRFGAGEGDEYLDPRSLIRRHYRSFQVLMAQADMPRRPGQTPSEFETALEGSLPSASLEVAAITRAYVAARYADDRTPLADPGSVARSIVAVRGTLRGESTLDS